MSAYYNEIDPFAAQWLRNLIAAGHIAPGEVDERSILEVAPDDLRGFTQCHFFAGIGVWSYALRRAGWDDSRPVWTGSCPCQPFSAAGKGDEFDDERHLWPAWFRLIRECRPVVVVGEQVSSKVALAWFDHVSTDLEGEGYTVGAVDTCAAGFGAPHIRQRLYFVADGSRTGQLRAAQLENNETNLRVRRGHDASDLRQDAVSGMADSDEAGQRECCERDCQQDESRQPAPCGRDADGRGIVGDATSGGRGECGDAPFAGDCGHPDRAIEPIVVGDTPISTFRALDRESRQGRRQQEPLRGSGIPNSMGDAEQPRLEGLAGYGSGGHGPGRHGKVEAGSIAEAGEPGPTNGFWRDAEWIACRDGKARPVEPGSAPLAHGAPNRVGRLRGYGNAICAPQAEEFVRAYMEIARS